MERQASPNFTGANQISAGRLSVSRLELDAMYERNERPLRTVGSGEAMTLYGAGDGAVKVRYGSNTNGSPTRSR